MGEVNLIVVKIRSLRKDGEEREDGEDGNRSPVLRVGLVPNPDPVWVTMLLVNHF